MLVSSMLANTNGASVIFCNPSSAPTDQPSSQPTSLPTIQPTSQPTPRAKNFKNYVEDESSNIGNVIAKGIGHIRNAVKPAGLL